MNELMAAMPTTTMLGAELVTVKQERNGYRLSGPMMNGGSVLLERSTKKDGRDLADRDFGVIFGTKKPSLLKSGAEKIANACGMLQHYTIESKIEDPEKPLFFYTVKCELCKISNDGKEYVFYTSYGSANTLEKRNGRNGAFDAANATLKMAQKRALVAAVISMGGLSDLFTQDMENEDYMSNFEQVKQSTNPEAPATQMQLKNLYLLSFEKGYSVPETNKAIKAAGFDPKALKQKDIDAVRQLFEKEKNDGKE